MKKRNGFVSNSSSSSFVLAFKKIPESIKETQKILFGDQEFIEHSYYNEGKPISTESIAKLVFEDIQKRPSVEEKHVAHALDDGYVHGQPSFSYDYDNNIINEERDAMWKKEEEELEVWSRKKAKEFCSENKGFYFRFEYSDNGEGGGYVECLLETGNYFDNVPHIKISQH